MRLREMNFVVTRELLRWPRGPRGSAQNVFRFAYSAYRLNSLGRRPVIACSTAAAVEAALRSVRKDVPGFTPRVAGTDT